MTKNMDQRWGQCPNCRNIMTVSIDKRFLDSKVKEIDYPCVSCGSPMALVPGTPETKTAGVEQDFDRSAPRKNMVTVDRDDLLKALNGFGFDDPEDDEYDAYKRLRRALGRGD